MQITSIKDPLVVEARELSTAAGRARRGKCLLEEAESIGWALDAGLRVEAVFHHAAIRDDPFLRRCAAAGIPCYATSDGILKKISDTTYLVPLLGVAVLPPPPQATGVRPGDFVVVLDRVQDQGNLGTIVRTARAFGVHDLFSTTPDLDLLYKKTVAASRGKVFDMRVWRFPSGAAAMADLKRRGYQVVATSPHARDIQGLAPLAPHPVALVVGNETDGVADDVLALADVVVQIPMSGPVESLNVGVAAGISLFELKIRMVLTMLVQYIQSNLGREVNVTGQMIATAFDALVRMAGDLSGTQVILLMMLKCDEAMSRAQVARDTATCGPEVDGLLAPLFARRYVETLPGQEDAIRLTAAGEQALAHLWPVVERAEAAVLAGFSAEETTQFTDYLKRIQANCTAILQEA